MIIVQSCFLLNNIWRWILYRDCTVDSFGEGFFKLPICSLSGVGLHLHRFGAMFEPFWLVVYPSLCIWLLEVTKKIKGFWSRTTPK